MSARPATFKKLVLKKETWKFREAVEIVTVPMCNPAKNEVCVKMKFVGINATDVNVTAGRGKIYGLTGLGFEGVGEVVTLGDDVQGIKIGQDVAFLCTEAFTEYVCIPASTAIPVKESKPEYVALMCCGLTASIGLEKVARITEGETILITAASGGTGHIAVQWAKASGCHVIGTCSADEKIETLKKLGCDRIINYKKENVSEILSKEYKDGIDVIWETYGGDFFALCLNHLAYKSRLMVVGSISSYKTDSSHIYSDINKVSVGDMIEKVHAKSASLQGYLVLHYKECMPTYLSYLIERMEKEEITAIIDDGKESTGKEFYGLEGIIRAVEHLHGGKNIGKVVARLS